MTQAQLLARYNAYRNQATNYPDLTTAAGQTGWNKLCGYHPPRTFSTSFPAAAPAATAAPDVALRANIVSYPTNGSYGISPAIGVRECPSLSTNPAQDVLPDGTSAVITTGTCGSTSTISLADGLKIYASISVTNPWGGTTAYSCPSATYTPTGLNQAFDIVVSAVADYASTGAADVGGEKDPSRLMCSARASVPIVSSSNTAQFRYYAHSGSTQSGWSIRKIGSGISSAAGGSSPTPTPPGPVYTSLSSAMGSWTPRPSATMGYVTQFGISPSGLYGFFVKAYEASTGTSDYMTSYYCTQSLPNGETTPSATTNCFTLPRMDGNQIEYLAIDYQGGRMWGILGRYMDPDRNTGGTGHGQDITGAVLVADCSSFTTPEAREAALFNPTTCPSTPVTPPIAMTPGVGAIVYTGPPADTSDYDSRKLDMTFLLNSPDAMWGATPNPSLSSLSKVYHMGARGLRDITSIFSGDGALYKVSSTRDCFSVAPTPPAPKYACTGYAFARLFFSPDALSAYAVMRYPSNPVPANDPGTGSGTVTCPSSVSSYGPVDKTARIYKLEIPNGAGSSTNAYACPNTVASYTVGDTASSNYKYILVSF